MSITQEVVRLLSDRQLQLISFSLGGQYNVLGSDLSQVAAALREGRWSVDFNPALATPYCDGDATTICLTSERISTADETYSALHEATHAMLFLTGKDRPGMEITVEIASTLLPIIYLYITRPLEVRSESFFAENRAARQFVAVVERNRMYETSAIVPRDDVQALWREIYVARRVPRH